MFTSQDDRESCLHNIWDSWRHIASTGYMTLRLYFKPEHTKSSRASQCPLHLSLDPQEIPEAALTLFLFVYNCPFFRLGSGDGLGVPGFLQPFPPGSSQRDVLHLSHELPPPPWPSCRLH